MKQVYTARMLFMAAHVRNLLEAEGIACTVRNEFIGSAAGELPPTECWPEVWVVDDAQEAKARALVAESLRELPDSAEPWQCPACGEWGEGNFGQCWNCGAIRRDA